MSDRVPLGGLEVQFENYLTYCLSFKNASLATNKSKRNVFRYFVRDSGMREFIDLDKAAIEQWIIKQKSSKQWSPATIRLNLLYIGSFCDWAVEHGYLDKNPVKSIPKPRIPKRIPSALTVDQANTVMQYVKHYPFAYHYERSRAVAVVATFKCTGVRKSELQKLLLSDIDLIQMQLRVTQGKGHKDRVIPFKASLAVLLQQYIDQRTTAKKLCPYFFTSLRGHKNISSTAISRIFRKLSKATEIHVTPHKLRHTFATHCLNNGMTIREVQELMGHSDITTTAMYLSVTPERLVTQVRERGIDA